MRMREMPPMTFADMDAAPFRFTAGGTLPCTPSRLFEELADPARWTKWFPLMHRASWTSPETARAGARREVAIRGFGRFAETILACEPGARFAFTMNAGTSPLARRMAEDYRVTATDGGARLEWTLAAVPTTVGRAAEKVLPLVLRWIWRGALRRLTGRVSQPG
jgi:uncharacterized protein YndB with AHSA1/START domain